MLKQERGEKRKEEWKDSQKLPPLQKNFCPPGLTAASTAQTSDQRSFSEHIYLFSFFSAFSAWAQTSELAVGQEYILGGLGPWHRLRGWEARPGGAVKVWWQQGGVADPVGKQKHFLPLHDRLEYPACLVPQRDSLPNSPPPLLSPRSPVDSCPSDSSEAWSRYNHFYQMGALYFTCCWTLHKSLERRSTK